MGKTREIKKRIKAVGNIRRITKTMQMIATAKFSAAQQRSVSSRPYTDALFELVASLAKGLTDIKHPLLTSGPAKPGAKPLLLVLTSDRGLCGPYNGSILRTGMHFVRENPASRAGFIELVGKKGAGFLKYNKIPVSQQHNQFGDKPTYEKVEELAQNYIDRFTSGEVSSVHVIYMKFVSAGKQIPTVMQLLPFKADEAEKKSAAAETKSGATTQYEFSPSAEELLGELLPSAVKAVLFQAFNDAIVSEQVARMVAMKAATDNAGKMGKRLTRVFNRARQAQITTELTEIVAGAAALG
ncbi:MAG: ATP synthase F1 subunit gamma [Phycisphaerae bacterium]|nr:ATP synthase F1 subunit gamma [Phycisphaerae bacterium]MBN8598513.1 ATP synthase F1 subunit gamma [Planctomycetota bacterium]